MLVTCEPRDDNSQICTGNQLLLEEFNIDAADDDDAAMKWASSCDL